MNEFIVTAAVFLGASICFWLGWFSHASFTVYRQERQMEAWSRARRFASRDTTKN